MNFPWIVEFPMFEHDAESGRWVAMHHPFTSPRTQDFGILETEPGKCRAKAYDLVINGSEPAATAPILCPCPKAG